MHEFKMKVEKYDNRVINKDYNTDFFISSNLITVH